VANHPQREFIQIWLLAAYEKKEKKEKKKQRKHPSHFVARRTQ
jgi:hypothetical protein